MAWDSNESMFSITTTGQTKPRRPGESIFQDGFLPPSGQPTTGFGLRTFERPSLGGASSDVSWMDGSAKAPPVKRKPAFSGFDKSSAQARMLPPIGAGYTGDAGYRPDPFERWGRTHNQARFNTVPALSLVQPRVLWGAAKRGTRDFFHILSYLSWSESPFDAMAGANAELSGAIPFGLYRGNDLAREQLGNDLFRFSQRAGGIGRDAAVAAVLLTITAEHGVVDQMWHSGGKKASGRVLNRLRGRKFVRPGWYEESGWTEGIRENWFRWGRGTVWSDAGPPPVKEPNVLHIHLGTPAHLPLNPYNPAFRFQWEQYGLAQDVFGSVTF